MLVPFLSIPSNSPAHPSRRSVCSEEHLWSQRSTLVETPCPQSSSSCAVLCGSNGSKGEDHGSRSPYICNVSHCVCARVRVSVCVCVCVPYSVKCAKETVVKTNNVFTCTYVCVCACMHVCMCLVAVYSLFVNDIAQSISCAQLYLHHQATQEEQRA